MRSSKSRSRNKSNRQRSLGNIVNRVFDSSGPEGKVRGTPQQIIDKYLTLARDAQLSNDRVAEQSFLQHAEHYTRMLGEAQREMAERQQQYQQQNQNHRQNGDEDRDNGGRGNDQREQPPRDYSRDYGTQPRNGRDHGEAEPKTTAAETPLQEAEKPQAEDKPDTAEKPVSTRSSRSRSKTGIEKPEQQKTDSLTGTGNQPQLGLPDALGSEDEGGLVETPEAGSTRKSRSTKTTSTRSRSTTSKTTRTSTRRKSSETAEAAPETPVDVTVEPGGSDTDKG